MRNTSAKKIAAAAVFALAASTYAANHTVTPATDGRMLNLRTVYPSVGDTVTLPAADEGCSYIVGNTNIAEMVEANVMKILAPGATSVAYYSGSSVATWNDCAEVVVPPTPKGSGSVYVWTRTANDGSGNWSDVNNWTLVRGTGNESNYPNAADDVAMCFVNGQRKWMTIAVNADVTLGALWTGSVRHQYNANDFVARFNGPNKITFKSGTGDAELHVLGSATYTTNPKVHTFGYASQNRLVIVLESSVVMDCGYASGERTCISRDFAKFANADLTINDGCTFTVRNVNPANIGAVTHTLEFTSSCTVSGSGTFVNDSAATVFKGGDWTGFTGTYVEQGCGHLGYHDNNTNANTYQTGTNSPLAKMVVRGFPQNATTSGGGTFRGSLTSWGNFAGMLRVFDSASSNPGNRLNYAEIDMEGGFMDVRCDLVDGWEDPLLLSAPGKIVAKEGFSGIRVHWTSNETRPTNVLHIADISNANGAMIAIREPVSENYKTTAEEVRGWVTVGNFAQHAIGGNGSVVETNRNYKIIPWLVSPRNYSGGYSQFYGVDENGMLVTAADRKHGRLQDLESEEDNLAMEGQYDHLTDSKFDKVNSLFMRNVGSAHHYLRSDATANARRFEITSGGIILSFYGILGHIDDSGEGPESAAGEVYLPNRGYVWGINDAEQTKSGQIWEKLVAPNGVSFAAVNHASAQITLGGDQSGIEGDITINAGKLVLGTAETACKLADDCEIRIVGATSCLEIPDNATTLRGLKAKKIVLRDVAGHCAKISIPEGRTLVSKSIVVVGDDGVEVPLQPGVYASEAGTGVDFVDQHVTGGGNIFVPPPGFRVIVR